ncbi:class A beta-lactamase [Streptomyces sp. NRRL S-340]|uniref:class A beta-lactamase n=1 Tax=Streptomyces sp. NRRL S-340 TaxID=1463901 RepID=UPI00056941AF|nr:class A beta-lactamase [Streptomyces sp. NRRL S-340]
MTSDSPLRRRGLFKAGLALSTAVLAPAVTAARATAAPAATGAPLASGARAAVDELRALEERYAARLGLYARNARTGQTLSHRAGERFAMCSTFKAFAAAAVLRDHDRCAPLDKVVHYPPADVLDNSPITKDHVDSGMTVGELCAAAIQYSDNTAGNLLLRELGGPAGLTRFFRSLGDRVGRLDRWEPDLNTAVPGDPRDTTTPEAIATSLERVTLGRALTGGDREQLVTWLKGNTTSAERFRRGLPKGWVVGDKTGTGDYASANDIGVAWTTRGTPVVLAVLTSKPAKDAAVDNALVAEAAGLVARTLAPGE